MNAAAKMSPSNKRKPVKKITVFLSISMIYNDELIDLFGSKI